MRRTLAFSVTSRLATPAEQVWNQAVTWAGVNAELWPIRMTAPVQWHDRKIDTVPCGQPLFKSWILLFGLLPTDRHHFQLESLGPGFCFQENSSSWLNRQWRHQRRLEPADGGCIVSDHLVIEPRLAWLGFLLVPVYRLVFWNRHRKLRQWYGKGRK